MQTFVIQGETEVKVGWDVHSTLLNIKKLLKDSTKGCLVILWDRKTKFSEIQNIIKIKFNSLRYKTFKA